MFSVFLSEVVAKKMQTKKPGFCVDFSEGKIDKRNHLFEDKGSFIWKNSVFSWFGKEFVEICEEIGEIGSEIKAFAEKPIGNGNFI